MNGEKEIRKAQLSKDLHERLRQYQIGCRELFSFLTTKKTELFDLELLQVLADIYGNHITMLTAFNTIVAELKERVQDRRSERLEG